MKFLKMVTVTIFLGGCMTPPKYDPPKPQMPTEWKVEEPFRVAAPKDGVPKGEWWERFGDPTLTDLARRALSGSPTLAASAARLAQARATFSSVSGQQWPQGTSGCRRTRAAVPPDR